MIVQHYRTLTNYHRTTKTREQRTCLPIPSPLHANWALPIRPRNPHTRGTPRYTKRQNINRNIRLHLRNDRKIVQEDFTNKLQLQATHFIFYSTLSDFERWNHTRMVLSHDATLIRQWTEAYRHGKQTGNTSHERDDGHSMHQNDDEVIGTARKARSSRR